MQEKLKIGWCLNDFLSYLHATEEEFFDYLKKNFSNKAFAQMHKRLKTNEKRKSRQNKPHQNEKQALPAHTETVSKDSITSVDVDSLKEQEQLLVTSILQKENKHKNLISRRYNLRQIFQEQRNILLNLKHQLEEKEILVNNTYEEWLKVSSEMQSLTSSISEEKKFLECVREEIEAHTKISLFVYENGEIECENNKFALQTDSAEAINLFNTLVQKDVVETLTIKAIRQLATLILIVKSIKNNGFKYEITFESGTLQEVFEKIDY